MNAFLVRHCASAVLLSIYAASAAEPPSWSVTLEMQVVAVTPEAGLQLVPKLRNEKTTEAAYGTLQQMLQEDRAELLGWPILRAAAGARGISESVLECRYPAEYEPPVVPGSFGIPRRSAPPEKNINELWPLWGVMCPTAFEVRNTGVALEAEPTVAESGEWIHLDLVPQSVQLLRFRETKGEKSPAGNEGLAIQPDFTLARITTSFSLRNGRRVLMGTTLLREPTPRLILFLLKADAQRSDAPQSKP